MRNTRYYESVQWKAAALLILILRPFDFSGKFIDTQNIYLFFSKV